MAKILSSMHQSPPSPGRRRLLRHLGGGALLAAAGPVLADDRRPVVVLTSYSDDVISRFEAAFEKACPGYRLKVLWRMPHDAIGTLEQPGQGGVDVYWSASPRNFARLKAAGAWRRLEVDRSGLPERIGNTRISDADGTYLATETAAYGFAVSPPELARLGVPLPTDWSDLADPRLAGRIALPIPSRVGFAPVLVDIVLQAWGWEKGWALWSEIAGLSTLIDRGGPLIADEVASGRSAIGLSIDFFVASAVANGAPVRFVYPAHGGVNPGQVAVTAGAPNPAGAQAFSAFVLSPAGQKLLTHPDIRKLPVRPAVYADLPGGYYDPFRAAAAGGYDYDADRTQSRLPVVAAAFDALLVEDHAGLVALWRRLHMGEARGLRLDAARRALTAPPLTEADAADPGLQAAYRDRVEGAAAAPGRREAAWHASAIAGRAEAASLLTEAGA